MISFARGVPAPECLPVGELADCARAVFERDGETALNYGPRGRLWAFARLAGERHGVAAGPDRAHERLAPGPRSARRRVSRPSAACSSRRRRTTAPCASPTRHGIEVAGVPHDAEGIDPDALEDELDRDRRPALLYLLPTFQNPTGRTISLERRRRAARARRRSRPADPRGRSVPARALRRRRRRRPCSSWTAATESSTRRRSRRSSRPGSASAISSYPPTWQPTLEAVAAGTYLVAAFSTQAIVFEFLQRGLLEPNVERVCGLLRARRDALLSALERELPEASWSTPAGGYFLWLDLPAGVGAARGTRRRRGGRA